MKTSDMKRKSFVKTVLTAAVMIGSTTGLFQGLTQVAAANEIGKKDIIPTSYAAVSYPAAGSLQSAQESAPEGYKKANYTVVDNNLPYYRDKKPTEKDIARDTAAEIGAQALWAVFGINLEGKTLEMSYNPATENNRATWYGNWWIDGINESSTQNQDYFFSLDAVTGELHSIQHIRTLKGNVSTGFDGTLAKNPQEYEALAKSVAEQFGAVQGLVKSVEYANQGSSNNDPTIDIRVTGESGERAQISFSRHDKALLGIAYDSWCKEADAMVQRMEREAQERLKEVSPIDSGERVLFPRS